MTDPAPILTRSQCRDKALEIRSTLGETIDLEELTNNDIPALQLALTASLLYAVMALDQDRPA